MDGLTHALLGATLAQLPSPHRCPQGRGQRLGLGALGGLFPDIDYALFPRWPLEFLAYWHQGPTHSLLLAPLWAGLLALVLRLHPALRIQGRGLFLFLFIGILSHDLLDALTGYGTQLLYPLSVVRFSADLLFVIDVYFTLLLGLCLAVLYRRPGRRVVLLPPLAYLGLLLGLKQLALYQGGAPVAIPQPFSPLYWQVIDPHRQRSLYLRLAPDPVAALVSSRLGYPGWQQGYQAGPGARWQPYGPSSADPDWQAEVEQAWRHPALRPFRDFARYPYLYRLERHEDERCVWFSDLRYDWPALPASFRYGLCHRAGDDWRLYRMRYLSERRQRL